MAGAIFSSLGMLGLSLSGLTTTNCEQKCELFSGEQNRVCMELCWTNDIVGGQPESLRTYCRAVLGFVAPACELMLAFHSYSFPIKGMRLRRLYHTVMEEQGDHTYLEANQTHSPLQGDIISRTQAQSAVSTIGLVAESIGCISEPTWQQQLDSAVVSVNARHGPKSCAVVIAMLDDISPVLTPQKEPLASSHLPRLEEEVATELPLGFIPTSGDTSLLQTDAIDLEGVLEDLSRIPDNALPEKCNVPHSSLPADDQVVLEENNFESLGKCSSCQWS